jgi:hypothetical protein
MFGPANSGMLPIAGNWTGTGKADGVGLYSPTSSVFYLKNATTTGFADLAFAYGPANSGMKPIVGDWSDTGTDTIGIYNPTSSVFYLRNTNDTGFADTTFQYGPANASPARIPLTGNWTGSVQSELAATQVVASPDVPALTQSDLQAIVNQAITDWSQAGLDAATVQKLRQVQFQISDLGGAQLGEAAGNVVTLDSNAAGHGWFVDPTPASNDEFAAVAGSQTLQAIDARAVDKIDLLTVVEHELGHVAGLSDNNVSNDVMDGVLGVGVRRDVSAVDAALAN